MIRVELYRQLRRLRSWISLGALMILPVIVAIAERASGPDQDASIQERTLYAVSSASALNHALAALTFMSQFFLVIVVATFAADAIAAEASWGTLRYLLMRPVGRVKLIVSKSFVLLLLAIIATSSIVVSGLVSGTIAFGWGPVVTPFFGQIPASTGLLRMVVAIGYVSWGMAGVMAFALLVSTFTSSSSGVTGAAVALTVISQILGALPSMDFLHPVLLSHYWLEWSNLFSPEGSYHGMVRGVILQAGYVLVLGGLALWRFRRKDILA